MKIRDTLSDRTNIIWNEDVVFSLFGSFNDYTNNWVRLFWQRFGKALKALTGVARPD
jgi:hypothetical protein